MVTLLVTALAIFFVVGIGLYLWHKPRPDTSENLLPSTPKARSLFFPAPESLKKEAAERLAIIAAQQSEQLIARAQKGDRSALSDARRNGNGDLYNRLLNEFVQRADSDPQLLALMSYVTQNNLPVNDQLAQAAVGSWKHSPDRAGTAKALHFAALSDNAELYRTTVETAVQLWREQKIINLSAAELRALLDGEFWVLSAGVRSSGAGFVLKQTLASARRELEAASRAAR
jgi:hypothetical protein